MTRRLPRDQQRGFTLIELVALTSAALLVAAMLAPAVLSARETARAATCKNNLKGIGLALHMYHEVYSCFPPGWVTREVNGHATQGNGWMTSLLPYVDEPILYNRLEPDGRQLDELAGPRKAAAMTPIAKYRCPVDTTPELNPFRGGWPTSNYSLIQRGSMWCDGEEAEIPWDFRCFAGWRVRKQGDRKEVFKCSARYGGSWRRGSVG